MNRTEDIIYYNTILHNKNRFVIPASTLDQRDRDILSTTNEWEMSITRFTIPTNLLPLLIIPDRTVNTYSVTLSCNGNDYQQFVPYTQSSFRGLYGREVQAYYDIQAFLDDVNSALLLAFADVLFNNPACVSTQPPRFYYDSVTSLISCYVDRGFIDGTLNGVSMYMNTILFNLFQAFIAEYLPTPQPLGKDIRFKILDSNTLAISNVIPRVNVPNAIANINVTLLQLQQTFICISNFFSVRSLVITTSQIPVQQEYLPNISSNLQNQNVSNTNRSIVSDFEIPAITDQNSFRTSITYIPTAEYRMISLLGDQSLNRVDFQVLFTDTNGLFYPLYLDVDKTISIKTMFRRKKIMSV